MCVLAVISSLALVIASGPADAGGNRETVSMAFKCATVGGKVRLRKAADQAYAVIGRREQQTLRVCGSSSGARCRDLQIYKFTFDCVGKPVEWIDAAAAAARGQPWKATLADDRMTLHHWPDGRSRDRRRPPLTLPAGFAPPPASGLRFSPPEKERENAPAAQPQDGAPKVSSLRFEQPPADLTAAKSGKSSPPSPTKIVTFRGGEKGETEAAPGTPVLMSPADLGWTATAVIGEGSARETWWKYLLPSAMPSTLLAGIGIAALLLSATAVAARQQGAHRWSGGAAATLERSSEDATLGPRADEASPPPLTGAAGSADEPDAVAESASALSEARSSEPAVTGWGPVIEMRAVIEAQLDHVHQIVADHVPEGAVRDVLITDLAVIEARLRGRDLAAAFASGRVGAAEAIYSQALIDLERTRTLSRIEHERALQVVSEPHRSPETLEEACSFLGVNPRATEAVVKKVVDALRQNWHPDLAGDEPDRQAREERIKHINAAWDLIRAR